MKETTEETGVVVNEALPTMEEAVPQLAAMDETIDQLENVNPTAGTKARKIWKRGSGILLNDKVVVATKNMTGCIQR